jgi:hypothetical protein
MSTLTLPPITITSSPAQPCLLLLCYITLSLPSSNAYPVNWEGLQYLPTEFVSPRASFLCLRVSRYHLPTGPTLWSDPRRGETNTSISHPNFKAFHHTVAIHITLQVGWEVRHPSGTTLPRPLVPLRSISSPICMYPS